MPLVVLTYPGHFLLTALTIQSYLKFHTPTSITVIVDDLSNLAWPGYLDDCQSLYNCEIIKVSSLDVITRFKDNPWIRQQIVKLHLDLILPFDKWFFTDGDIEYHFPVPHDAIPYVITRGGLVRSQQNAYVTYLLGIDNPGVYAEHPHMDWDPTTYRHQVCVSNPPFRNMQANTLQSLRNYVQQLHNKTIEEIHIKDLNNIDYSVSEWELLSSFQIAVLKNNVDLVYYPTVPLDQARPDSNPNQPNFCGTCYNSDSGYTREWWSTKAIQVSDHIWNIISKISK